MSPVNGGLADRRTFLKRAVAGGGALALASLAGCTGDTDDDEELDSDEDAGEPLPEFAYYNNPENYNPGRHDTINLIAEQWNEIGFDVDVEVLEWTTLFSSVNDEYEYDLATWSQFKGTDPAQNVGERFTSAYADEPGQGNINGYQEDRMDELILEQQIAETMDERVDAFHEIQEMIAEDVPWHPILIETEMVPYKTDQLDGFVDYVDGYNRIHSYVNVEVLEENEDGRLRGFWTEALENLNPWDHNGLSKHVHIMNALFEQPIVVDPETLEHDPELSLVTEIERPDLETIVWEIRDDASWSDGEALTADDVAFTFQTVADESPPTYSYEAGFIESAEATDDETVEIALTEEIGIASNGIFGNVYVAPEHEWEGVDAPYDELAEEPVSSSIMEVEYWDPGEELSLIARDDHRLDFEIEGIRWEIIEETSTIFELTERGDINYHPFAQPSLELQDAEAEMDDFAIQITEGSGWTHLNINMRNEGLDDRAVRQALIHGIPKTAINEQLYYEYFDIGHSYVTPAFADLHNSDVTEYEEGVEPARETLREAGYVITSDGVHHAAE